MRYRKMKEILDDLNGKAGAVSMLADDPLVRQAAARVHSRVCDAIREFTGYQERLEKRRNHQ